MNETCGRCGREASLFDKCCKMCGAHPLTGLTAPEGEEIWLKISEKLIISESEIVQNPKNIPDNEQIVVKRTQKVRTRRPRRKI